MVFGKDSCLGMGSEEWDSVSVERKVCNLNIHTSCRLTQDNLQIVIHQYDQGSVNY